MRKKTIKEIITLIEHHKKVHTVKLIYKVLKFPRSTYYKALLRVPSNCEKEAQTLKSEIYDIWKESKRRYGAPKIQKVLEGQGKKVSLKRVQRYMRELVLHLIVVKKFLYHSEKVISNEKEILLNCDFTTNAIHQKWCMDITYIYIYRKKDGCTYLAERASCLCLFDPFIN